MVRGQMSGANIRHSSGATASITHCTVVRECCECKGDDESLWEREKLDPPPHETPLTDGRQDLCR